MARVPDQPVAAEIEHAVQGQAELDHAQIRGEVGRPLLEQVAQHVANFGGELRKLRRRHAVQIVGRLQAGRAADASSWCC